MIYREIYKDLFTVDLNKYVLAHCISKDAALGAGIAIDFKKRFSGIQNFVLSQNPKIGDAILYKHKDGHIFNLVTKSVYNSKPTYDTLKTTLIHMKKQMIENNYKYLAIPKIACGLDRLSWPRVREILQEIFNDTGIEILVCRH